MLCILKIPFFAKGLGTVGPTVGFMFFIALFVTRILCRPMPKILTISGSAFILLNLILGYFFEARAVKRKKLSNNANLSQKNNPHHHTPITDTLEALQIASRKAFGTISALFSPLMYLNAFLLKFKRLEDVYEMLFRIIYLTIFIIASPAAIIQTRETYQTIKEKLALENKKLRAIYSTKPRGESKSNLFNMSSEITPAQLTRNLSLHSAALFTLVRNNTPNSLSAFFSSARVAPELYIQDVTDDDLQDLEAGPDHHG